MVRVAGLYLYPIKGLKGISLSQSRVEARGLQHDRRWMLIDADGRFLSQRNTPRMCLYRTELSDQELSVAAPDGDSIAVPLAADGERLTVQVWGSECVGARVSDEADAWFSRQLATECRLVHMPDDFVRPTHPDYTRSGDRVGFADAFPVLVASQASLDDLNSRLATPIPINRFRPNIVVEGCGPFEEDVWPSFMLNSVGFRAAKRCGRCQVTTTNQDTAEVGTEPLRTLATYRRDGNTVLFGNYFVPESEGSIAVGDRLLDL